MTALPITSAGRFSLLGPRGITTSWRRRAGNADPPRFLGTLPLSLSPPAVRHPVKHEAAYRQIRRLGALSPNHGYEPKFQGGTGTAPMPRPLETHHLPPEPSARTKSSIASDGPRCDAQHSA